MFSMISSMIFSSLVMGHLSVLPHCGSSGLKTQSLVARCNQWKVKLHVWDTALYWQRTDDSLKFVDDCILGF